MGFVQYMLNWAIEPPEDDDMNHMKLPSRHRIQNSSPGGRERYLSVTENPYNIESL